MTPDEPAHTVPFKRSALLWLWLVVVTLIPLLSVFGRRLQHWSAENVGYHLIAWVIGLGLLIAIGLLVQQLWRRSNAIPYLHLGWFLPLFLVLPLMLERVEERLHFLTFGAFGALALMLFAPRTALVLCLAYSGGDELLQHYLPDRVGDWRDVGMNALASLAAALFTWLWLKQAGRGGQ